MRVHVRKKHYRVHCRELIMAGKVNTPNGDWVSGPGPASSDSYTNGWSGTARQRMGR